MHLERVSAKMMDLLMQNNIAIAVEQRPLGPSIVLTDKATGDKFDIRQGPIKGGNI
ncbi:hypothetical protein D3C71_234280 [compost metagenome]